MVKPSFESKIYSGAVVHARRSPTQHKFTYSLFMMYLDLDELPHLFDRFWCWSARGFNLAHFRRSDHLAGKISLKDTVLDTVEKELGARPQGKVFLLTHLRYFGHVLNPVSFYYCYNANNQDIDAVVAEVHNTPWGEQHAYVLDAGQHSSSKDTYTFDHHKDFHVSPFLPMDMRYFWRVSKPSDKLSVHIENRRDDKAVFSVSMTLKCQEIQSKSLALALLKFPFMTIKVLLAIYFEALRLWLKKTPLFSHPTK